MVLAVNEQEEARNRRKCSGTLLLIVIFIDTAVIAAFLDIPVLRQILGFMFLTFLPGWLIIHILGLNNLSQSVKLVLSVGLSVAFVMFFGLLINTLYPLLGYSRPLDTLSVVSSFSVALLFMAAIAYLRSGSEFSINLESVKLTTKEKAYLLLPAFFPFMSILGMRIMNTTDNNTMLMALLFLIPAYTIFISIKHNQVSDRVYPPMIFLISISLVLLLGLRSNHIIGADAHTEYYLFQQTFQSGRWQIFLNSTLDSCLSISILPTIYQSFLNINSEYLFKILYPILFSISPLVVYFISKKYIGSFYAFLASLFFMSQTYFIEAAFSPRTVLAILFFTLAISVLFLNGLNEVNKKLLFIVFAVSCIVSHYSTTYIFFIVLLLTWVGMEVIPGILLRRRKLADPPSNPGSRDNSTSLPESKGILRGGVNAPGATTLMVTQSRSKEEITVTIVVLFFVVLFFWYSQVTGAAFTSGVRFITITLRKLQDFFILESRGEGVAAAFGAGLGEKGIPQKITFVFSWLTIAFIAIGVLTTLFRYRDKVAFYGGVESEPPGFLSQKFEAEFFILSLVCSAVLVAAVAMPYVFIGYGMFRTYCQMAVVLSPFFIIGGILVARFLHLRRAYLVVLVALIPYFMCNTGTMYQIFGVPQAITLSSEGQQYDVMFVHDQESNAAKWLKSYTMEDTIIYADNFGERRLISQGMINLPVYVDSLVELVERGKLTNNGYIYLRYCSVADGKLYGKDGRWYEIKDYQNEFVKRKRIYTNGGSEIWR